MCGQDGALSCSEAMAQSPEVSPQSGDIGLTLSTPPAPRGQSETRSLTGSSPDHPAASQGRACDVGRPHIGQLPGRFSPGLACTGRAT